MSEKSKKLPSRYLAGTYLDVINAKLATSHESIEILIQSTTIESIRIDGKNEMVAKITLLSTEEPTSTLEEALKKLIYFYDSKKENPDSYPVKIYDIKPQVFSEKYYTFKIDIILTKMDMNPHDLLELN